MRRPSTLYNDQLRAVYTAIKTVEDGGSTALKLRGKEWSSLEDLYQLADFVRLQAAVAAIEEGAQSYTIDDHSFNRADYKALCERRDRLEKQLFRVKSGGIRVRNVVPIDG